MTEPGRGEVRKKAVRGAVWTVGLGLGTRVAQLGGTLALTYFLSREVAGELANAALYALNAHMVTTLGVPTAIAVRKTDARGMFHATVAMLVTGVLGLGVAAALMGPFGGLVKSPNLARYFFPLAVATLLMRMGTVPERLLQHRLLFREASLARSAGELSYALVSVGAAYLGAGGWAIVAGHLARGFVALVGCSWFMPPREWAKPYPLDRRIFRDLFAFGVPLGAALWLAFAARNLDNFVVSSLFGAGVVGAYNLAYNLADIPASQVAEQIGDVLTPSFARLDGEARRAWLPRTMAVVAFAVFPLAFGLGATGPTVATTLLRPEWHSAGAMLGVLAALSVTRPIAWIISAYLQTTERTRAVMWLSALRLVAVLGAVAGLGVLFGPLGACAGAGIGFSLHALGNVAWVVRQDGFGVRELLGGTGRVVAACVPLCAAVLGARAAVAALGVQVRGVGLAAEVVAGAAGYAAGAALFARPQIKDIVRLLRDLRRDRKG
jgi:lipopolysaccharide exporter